MIVYSPDQTTRIHANGSKEKAEQECWHEICRPQVHGYDLIDATFLSATRFISIADEKVARVFDAPKSFVTFCKHLSGILTDVDEVCCINYYVHVLFYYRLYFLYRMKGHWPLLYLPWDYRIKHCPDVRVMHFGYIDYN